MVKCRFRNWEAQQFLWCKGSQALAAIWRPQVVHLGSEDGALVVVLPAAADLFTETLCVAADLYQKVCWKLMSNPCRPTLLHLPSLLRNVR